jgi:hypothetical protein
MNCIVIIVKVTPQTPGSIDGTDSESNADHSTMQERLHQLVTARVGVLKAILEGVQMNETQMRAMLTDHTVEDLKLFIPEIGILCIDIVGICPCRAMILTFISNRDFVGSRSMA